MRLFLFGCPGLVQDSLSEQEMLPSHPLAPLHRFLERPCLSRPSCHFVHQWWVSTYTAVSSAWLGPPPWGRTGAQSAHNSLHKYSPAQRLLRQAWQQRLSRDFLSQALGNTFSFTAHHVPGRACASANPHSMWRAPATECHRQHLPQPRESVTSTPPCSPPCHTQCSANTVPCADLLQPRTYPRGQEQHWLISNMLVSNVPVATSQR